MAASETREINPAKGAFPINPDDANDIIMPTRAVYIGGDGSLRVTMYTGGIVTFAGMVAGTMYPISVIRVWNTGTTATQIVGLA